MADPRVVNMVRRAARQTGLNQRETTALMATTLQETHGTLGEVGDQGTSFGPFQFHRGGALGNHSPAWANSYAAFLNRAQEFKRLGVQGGQGAAAVQRPADPAGYARGVDGYMNQAAALLGNTSFTPRTVPGASRTAPTSMGVSQASQGLAAGRSGLLGALMNQNAVFAGQAAPGMPGMDPMQALLGQFQQFQAAKSTPGVPGAPAQVPGGPATPTRNSNGGATIGGIVQKGNYAGIDQGVDFRGKGAVPAFGDAVITRVDTHSGWPGGGMVTYKITSGAHAGRFVYVAENLSPTVRVGQRVRAGQTVAVAHGAYPYTEMGWAADPQGTTLAQAQKSGYVVGGHEFPTNQGKDFNRFLGNY